MRHGRIHGGISEPLSCSGGVVRREHDAARFAARRFSRAAILAAASSSGRLVAVPKYTSSGVWPRNAACGIWVLCASMKKAIRDRVAQARREERKCLVPW